MLSWEKCWCVQILQSALGKVTLVLLFMPEEEYSWCRLGPAQLPPSSEDRSPQRKAALVGLALPLSSYKASQEHACHLPFWHTEWPMSKTFPWFTWGLGELSECFVLSTGGWEKSALWKTDAESDLSKLIHFIPHLKWMRSLLEAGSVERFESCAILYPMQWQMWLPIFSRSL